MVGFFLDKKSLFLFWLIVSSVYYLENLFTGDVLGVREVSFFSLILKYMVCLIFSIYAFRENPLYVFTTFVVLIACVALFLGSSSDNVGYVVVMMVILSCFFGMPAFFSRVLFEHEATVIRVLIFSGFLVSLLSIYQYLFLQNIYFDYWRKIGAVRLNSSLLNPNNMGVFVSACFLLLLVSIEAFVVKLMLAPFFIFSIVMSGSRTAILAFLVVFIVSKASTFCVTYLKSVVFLFCSVVVFILTLFFYYKGYGEVRAFDFSSDGGRLSMQMDFISGFDLSYFYPDFHSERYLLIQESSYLMLLNSIGVIGILFLLLFFVVFYRVEVKDTKFKTLFYYYIIVLFMSNFLNSYPNNLLFFISLGCLISPRRLCHGCMR